LLAQNKFGFPNVWMSPDLAIEQYRILFHSIPDVKLLGLALPETYWDEFMKQYNSAGFEAITRNGVYKKLSQREYYLEGKQIGYDVLGFEGADFCSLLCSGSERDAYYPYGARYNQFGFITEYEPAARISEAISQNVIQLEDGFWCPWLVIELDLPPLP